ncbi:hypothetical protein OAL28_01020 [bacterium]|nr:hypothetical protein [bacterium]
MIDWGKANRILSILDSDMKKVMYYDILHLCDGRELDVHRKVLKWLFKFNFSDLKNAILNNKLIVTFPYSRKDHRIFLNSIIKDLNHALITDFRIKFNLNLFITLKHLIESFFLISKLKLNFKEFLFIWSNYIFYKNSMHELKSLDFGNEERKYLSFNGSVSLEALICVCCNEKDNITTYSLTHGQTYINYKNFKPIDIINAVNICSEYIIVWGENQKQDLNKNYNFNLKNILIGGNPKYSNLIFKKVARNSKKVLVLLPRREYLKGSLSLLNLLMENNLDIIIKLHPSSNLSDFSKYSSFINKDNIKEIINKNDILYSITFNSSVYYELWSLGIPCFRYSKFENDTYSGLNDKFESSSELNLLIKSLEDNFIFNNNEIISMLLKNLGVGINNYKSILQI